MVWPGSEPRIEPRTGEKFSFNVDIHVVAATFIHISQLILTRIQWPVQCILSVLNCFRIEPRTGEKLRFNVDIHVVAATFIHARAFVHVSTRNKACSFIHFEHPMGGVFVIVLYITSLSTNEIGRYLNYIKTGNRPREGCYC